MQFFEQSFVNARLRRVPDELVLRRLKKRRLLLRDQIAQIQAELDPPEPA